MKRTNLVLDEELLREAVNRLGTKTYSEAVNLALEQSIKLAKMRGILDLVGSGAWEGDLSAMREDRPRRGTRKAR